MDQTKLRAWLSHKQGLDGTRQGHSSADVLQRSGWARSVGGVGPYLTLFARAGITREQADADAARLEIYELPSARGCTYVLPARDFPLALKIAQAFGGGEMRTAEKLGVTAKEIDRLCGAIVGALEKGPLDPEELRQSVGKAVRDLGLEGKKKGLNSTLPVALGNLQTSGDIRRIPVNGRFDTQRYRYTLWRPNPVADFKPSAEEAATRLARLYFSWIGPATIAEFQWFSGLGVKAVKAALEPLRLEPMEHDDDRLLLPEDRQQLAEFKPPADPHYTLVSSLDSIVLLRRNHRDLLDAKDLEREVVGEGGPRPLSGFADLPSHGILDRGRVIGLWEYDATTESIAWVSFIRRSRQLEEAVARTEEFVRTQLGDARSFSLDSPKSRTPRVEALRKAAGR